MSDPMRGSTPSDDRGARAFFLRLGPLDRVRFLFYVLFSLVRRHTGLRLVRSLPLRVRGLRFRLEPGQGEWKIVHENVVREQYLVEPGFRPRPGWTCLDVGANIGATSLAWWRVCREVHVVALEPHPVTLGRLRTNLALNGAGSKVEVVASAVGRTEGELRLRVSPRGTMAMRPEMTGEPGEEIEVPVTTLDRLYAQMGLDRVDLLKVDIEGFEVEALDGAETALRRTDRVVLEHHSEELRRACLERLARAGFDRIVERDDLVFASRDNASANT